MFFTPAMTCISRTLVLRDRLLRRLPKIAEQSRSVGTTSEHRIPSGENILDAALVEPKEQPVKAVVLICHGIGETVEYWRAVQMLLAENGVASLVFDYSGYGRSTGTIRSEQCERDAIAAFNFLKRQIPSETISLLGFSLGSGIAAAVAHKVTPHRLVLCASYTSFRGAASSIGLPKSFVSFVPAIWNTEETLRTCTVPVLIVHGERDQLFPSRMACELAAACCSSCELIVVPALSHNAPIYRPQLSYWLEIASRLRVA